jgi:hypothetical protein
MTIVSHIMNAARILPAAKAMKGSPKMIRLGKDSKAHLALANLGMLIQSLATRPTHVNKLVPHTQSALAQPMHPLKEP